MIILPVSSAPQGTTRAQALLREVADQRVRCTVLVFGDSNDSREIASRADVRAHGHAFRQVVWVPDIAVVNGVPRYRWLTEAHGDGWDAVAATIRFETSSRLRRPDALRFYLLEKAFADALAGTVIP
ncbi:MAG TPA: hypothetical protein VM261_00940 [Kofleriaceae bacterium]|nr:hypothetical protein [Kofleriaceae bacterium]